MQNRNRFDGPTEQDRRDETKFLWILVACLAFEIIVAGIAIATV
jgi:hypothetical protein